MWNITDITAFPSMVFTAAGAKGYFFSKQRKS